METTFIKIIPVLPSENIERDIAWYNEKAGFITHFFDNMYAVLFREDIVLHLQWHANTPVDPLLGGSVIRIYVKNIMPFFNEMVIRGTVSAAAFKANTAWQTNEFGFFDLNQNAIFVMEDISK
jgi:hypothetical protein